MSVMVLYDCERFIYLFSNTIDKDNFQQIKIIIFCSLYSKYFITKLQITIIINTKKLDSMVDSENILNTCR